ncbi:DUF2513 domain-containing protein [Christensenellaceae bacterium OttesenSCG-928-K19]|nr:DUF2513 domain-containing protein [Christensenellaceae bacterium OttesenSCG-928-K19]
MNLECVRDLLVTMDKEDMGDKWIFTKDSPLLEKYSAKEVIYNTKLCNQVGYINGFKSYFGSCMEVFGLTERGRAFLEKLKDDAHLNRLSELDQKLTPSG